MTHRILAVCAVLSLAAAAHGQWKGSEETRDGVSYVQNPASPVQPEKVVQLEELWRHGGYDDDELFGVITSVVQGKDGNLYALDSQLNEVKVYGPDGELLRSIGREGEGPGEFRNAFSLFLAPSGDVAVVQAFPPKIILLTPEGDPAGTFAIPKPTGKGFQIVQGAQLCGDNVAMMQMNNRPNEDGNGFTMREVLTLSPQGGDEATELASFETSLDMSNPVIKEEAFVGGMRNGRWAAFADGRVAGAASYRDYLINVYGADAKLHTVISREYPTHKRNAEQKKIMRDIFERATVGIPAPNKTYEIMDINNPVMNLYARDDGSLWVATSRGRFDRPDGSIGVFDVFDRDGHFAQQIDLRGQADPWDDLILFAGDRVVVVTDWLPAMLALQSRGAGASDDEDTDEDVEPMQIICYRLDAPQLGLN